MSNPKESDAGPATPGPATPGPAGEPQGASPGSATTAPPAASGAPGSVRICVCMGSSCFARGNGKNTRLLKEYLARSGLDRSVELVGLLCEGRCSSGPNVQIDGHTYRGVTPQALEAILDHHLTGPGGKAP